MKQKTSTPDLITSVKNLEQDNQYIQYKNKVFYHKSLNLSDKVYRYIALQHLVEMLQRKSIYVANRKTFTDKHEQLWTEDIQWLFTFTEAGYTKKIKTRQENTIKYRETTKNVCISCWTFDKHKDVNESLVLWNHFGLDKCRIETTIQSLLDNIDPLDYEVVISPIQYSKEHYCGTFQDCLFSKTLQYQDEQEVRMCVLTTENYINLPIHNLDAFIHKIRLPPFNPQLLNEWIKTGLLAQGSTLIGKIEFSHIAEY